MTRSVACGAACVLLTALGACAPAPLHLPTGPSAPLLDSGPILRDALAHCVGLHSITAELGLSGRVGTTKLRGRLQVGFARPDRLRLEAVAPFGAPFFIVAGQQTSATLWLPRDARVLRDAAPADLVDALAGFSATPDDLAAWLAGCPAAVFPAGPARSFGADWTEVDAGGRIAWFHRTDRWHLVASSSGGLSVEFAAPRGVQPTRLRIRRDGSADRPAVDVGLSIGQVDTNVALGPEAFRVDVPSDATPITLDELRRSGPLRESTH